MDSFKYDADGTIEEFRRRSQEFKGHTLNFDSSQMYEALGAALWFAVEEYERHVAKGMVDNGVTDLSEFLALHNLVHDMADILVQMFASVDMELTGLPLMCSKPSPVVMTGLKNLVGVLDQLKEAMNKIEAEESEAKAVAETDAMESAIDPDVRDLEEKLDNL